MSALRAQTRAAAMTLLKDYAAANGVKLQVYPGRPRTLVPPSAFVDSVSETVDYVGPQLKQRTVSVQIRLLHRGEFDTQEAVDQADVFADGFSDYVAANVHAIAPNTTVGISAIEDDATYTPDWVLPGERRTMYSTVFTLEGYAED